MPDPRPRRGPPGRGQPGRGPADSGPVGASSPGTGPRGTGRRGVSPQGAGPRGPGLPDDRDRRRRELSQNYLRSDGVAAAQFLHQVDPDPGGLCLEVGAGEGILTVGLAAMFREVVAYELDPE